MDLLERAVQAMRAGRQPQLDRPLDHGTEIDLRIPALIPADYLPDVHTRLIMYKRIASARDGEELESLQEEMIDRFGLLPPQTRNLIAVTRLKQRAAPLGIRKIDLGEHGGRLHFLPDPDVDPASIIKLVQEQPAIYRLDGGEVLRITRELPDAESRLSMLDDLFDNMTLKHAA